MNAEIKKFFGTTEVEIVRDDDGNKIRVSLYDNSVVMLLEKVKEEWECKYCTLTDDTFKLQQIDQILGPVSILTVNKSKKEELKNIEFFNKFRKTNLTEESKDAEQELESKISDFKAKLISYENYILNKKFETRILDKKFKKWIVDKSEHLKILELQCIFIKFIAFVFNLETTANEIVDKVRKETEIVDQITKINVYSLIEKLNKVKDSILDTAEMRFNTNNSSSSSSITLSGLKVQFKQLSKESKTLEELKKNPPLQKFFKEAKALNARSEIEFINICRRMFTELDYIKCANYLRELHNYFNTEQELPATPMDIFSGTDFEINVNKIKDLLKIINNPTAALAQAAASAGG